MSSNHGDISANNEHSTTPDLQCSICLGDLTNRCHSDSCRHLFCYGCLKQWSTISASCPLCKKDFKVIHHSFNESFHASYVVPVIQEFFTRDIVHAFPVIDFSRLSGFVNNMGINQVLMNNLNHLIRLTLYEDQRVDNISVNRNLDAITFRRQVYNDNLWAQPLPDPRGNFINCDFDYFRQNSLEITHLYHFIYRDVVVIRTLLVPHFGQYLNNLNTQSNESTIRNIILELLSRYAIRNLCMIDLIRPYLGEYTVHFCHELYNYITSPYNIMNYDQYVRYINYSDQQLAVNSGFSPSTSLSIPAELNHENVILESDDEIREPIATNSQTTNDVSGSDVGILRSSASSPTRLPSRSQSHSPINSHCSFIYISSSSASRSSSCSSSRSSSRQLFNSMSCSSSNSSSCSLSRPSSSLSSSSIETSHSPSRDQPSTSTGIQTSSNEQHNNCDIKNRKLLKLNKHSIFNNGGNQTKPTPRRVSKRIRQNKQNLRKKIATNPLCKNHTHNRNQSYTSSSSSEDTDTR